MTRTATRRPVSQIVATLWALAAALSLLLAAGSRAETTGTVAGATASETTTTIGSAPAPQDTVTVAADTASTTPVTAPVEFTRLHRIRLIDNSINPVSTRFILKNLEKAEERRAAFLLEMDTPGGLVSSTREIVKAFLAAKVPVIVYVAPNGSRAASAGVFITVAANVAAMAPSTHMGAATPISIDGSGEKPKNRRNRDAFDAKPTGADDKTTPTAADGKTTAPAKPADSTRKSTDDSEPEGDTESAAAAKALNDIAAWAEATARTRGRNAQWTRDTVFEARSSTAQEALALGVIDYIATSTAELIKLTDGKVVQTAEGPAVLRIPPTEIAEPITMGSRERFLDFLADPTIAYLLISLASICLLIEFYNPGLIVPGVLGLICFALAAISLNLLPISNLAVLLIILGIALILIEMQFPLFFVPTAGGIIFLIVGALLLIDEPRVLEGGYVPLGIAIGMGGATGGILAILTGLTIRVHRRPVMTGYGAYIGELAEVSEDLAPRGTVFFDGTYWSAVITDDQGRVLPDARAAKGQTVSVRRVRGLKAEVVLPSGQNSRP